MTRTATAEVWAIIVKTLAVIGGVSIAIDVLNGETLAIISLAGMSAVFYAARAIDLRREQREAVQQ